MNKKFLLRRMKQNAFFMSGLIIMTCLVILLLILPSFLQYSPTANSLTEKFTAPEYFSRGFEGHILGTDQLGRDILARIVQGGRTSIAIALVVVCVEVVLGTTMGLLAGYFGGIIDTLIMRICDIILAIPNLILAIAIMAVLGSNVTNLIIVLCFSGWVQICKLTRNNVIVAKSMEYVKASKALGASTPHIMFTQILPNVTTNIIIVASQKFGQAILTESALSFLSLGIAAPTPSWGNMIADGRLYLTVYPWIAMSAGVALMLCVLGANFLGDGLRDVLDPRR